MNIVLTLMAILFGTSLYAQVDDIRQWSLRFPTLQSARLAQTGCYGTSSYRYTLPSVAYVQAHRTPLNDFVTGRDLSGFVFTRDKNDSNQRLVVDLDSGEVSPIGGFGYRNKGVVLCICDRQLTHRNNCSYMDLRPVGQPFHTRIDDGPGNTWVDPVTRFEWYISPEFSNWFEAQAKCELNGYRLPAQVQISSAAVRMYNTRIGEILAATNRLTVWSIDEFDRDHSIKVWIPDADAASANKQEKRPVVCVR